jgi:hypothetical protein
MPFSNYLATRSLNWIRGVANGATTPAAGMPAAPSTLYISLHSADPGVNGTNADVTSIVSAARGSIVAANWSSPTASSAPASGFQISNTAEVQVTASAIGSATVSYFGIWDAATSGNFLEYGVLSNPLTIATGDIVKFAIGQLVSRHI